MLPGLNTLPEIIHTNNHFGGINLSPGCGENEFSDMRNMSADAAPAIGVRKKRAVWYRKSDDIITEGIRITDSKGITAATFICDRLVLCTSTSVYFDGKKLDGVVLNGSEIHRIAAFGRGFLILPENILVTVDTNGTRVSSTDAPPMDFAVCRNNRIYGCRYGMGKDGTPVNEIYVCKQGDASSWFCFDGISTDSYVAGIGTPGEFTGAAVCRDRVLFFKEDAIISVSGDCPAEYVIDALPCEGAQTGSDLAIVNIGDSVFYLSRAGVTVFDGSWPRVI